jgi:GT2 family glycosyltransferase
MSLSVIIPYHSAELYLILCLSSLIKDKESFDELIIVSNGNRLPDDLPAVKDIPTKVMHYDQAIGYSAAINRGAEQANSSYLLFCDADTFFPEPGWIKKHVGLISSNPNIGITSSKLVNYRTNRIVEFGIGRTRLNNFHPCRDALISDRRAQNSRQIQMACSAVMMIDRELFSQVGGFDESLRHYYQDLDLSLRVKAKKKELWVIGDAIAYHRGHSTNIVRSPFQIDERAHFTVKNAHLMEIDYPCHLKESLDFHKDQLTAAGEFGLVNLSTLVDLDEPLEVISQYAATKLIATRTPSVRDVESLTLPDILDNKIMLSENPLLFFVDRFLSLRFNALWQSARDTSGDMVVDRHANVFTFDQIVNSK